MFLDLMRLKVERIPNEAVRNKLIAKYGGSHEDFFSDPPEPDYEPEPVPDRVISVTLNEREQDVLDAIFVQLAWGPESEVITEGDWDTIVELAKKFGSGDLRQL
jgi:hypothetical protein